MPALKAPARRRRSRGSADGSTEPPSVQATGRVLSLDARRIEKALDARTRYKYVHPRVEREGLGWKIVSPNCSRNIDAEGGEIDIAWLVPHNGGGWLLFSRNHAQDCWQMRHHGDSLPAVLAHLCADPDREFWQ
ncbi:MAG: hypothetical protein Q7T97_14020 [Burkholderiaceae bacterium]|nr:hypothetical protein [Burkholderiaceae bacterium]